MTSELEANIVSVERLKEYSETPTEVGVTSDYKYYVCHPTFAK